MLAGLSAAIGGPSADAAPPLPDRTEQAAIFSAAGFKEKGGRYVRCEEETPTAGFYPGRIEIADLNGDGMPEAWVREGSVFCYGDTAEAFVLLTRDSQGAWRNILDEIGVPDVKPARKGEWPDIEVGGPGLGPFPTFRYESGRYSEAGKPRR
jgi:hypothetical protein